MHASTCRNWVTMDVESCGGYHCRRNSRLETTRVLFGSRKQWYEIVVLCAIDRPKRNSTLPNARCVGKKSTSTTSPRLDRDTMYSLSAARRHVLVTRFAWEPAAYSTGLRPDSLANRARKNATINVIMNRDQISCHTTTVSYKHV